MRLYSRKKLYLLSFLIGILLLGLWIGPRSSLEARPLYIGGGLGLAGGYFNQDHFIPLSVGLGRGAAKEEVNRLDAKEQEIIDLYDGSPPASANITQAEGGCPDVVAVLPETDISSGSRTLILPGQLIRIEGRRCLVSSSSGTSLGLSALELDFTAQYEYRPWLFFRTGVSLGVPIPVSYSLGVQYGGDANSIKVGNTDRKDASGDSIKKLSASVRANSKASVRYSGYHLQIPLLVGINLYSDEDSAFYWAYGLTISSARFVREVEGAQDLIINTTGTGIGTGPPAKITQDYAKVVNTDDLPFSLGLMTVMGARRRIDNDMFFYVEFRWLTGGSANLRTTGTQKQPGARYASGTAAAAALNGAFPGSVAQPLQTSESPGGGRTANGLDLSYDMRMLFGITYKFDY